MLTTSTDFLIVGGGIAGLRAAIELAPSGRVLILTKGEPNESNTGWAQGGIAAALGPHDAASVHGDDTVRAGAGLCDETAVRILVEEGPSYVEQLLEWGVKFDRDAVGRPALALEAAHSVPRVLHAGDATGREIGRALWTRAADLPSVEARNHALVTDLVIEDGIARGVRFSTRADGVHEVRARAILLASGGAGQVFRETTNPSVATGDGLALAYRAGARLADLEFFQFHPTALSVANAPRFLISEALRGDGARLVNRQGDTFMTRYHADGDLAPRDVVARSMVREMGRSGGSVFLTLAHLDPTRVRSRFPTITATCRQVGLDLATDRIPVGPAAHYLMGGVDADEWGRTSVPGLYAAGEVACTGVHGANRLASNSLLEGLVFGARAAQVMCEAPRAAALKANRRLYVETVSSTQPVSPTADANEWTISRIRDGMWQFAGLFRTKADLGPFVHELDAAYDAMPREASGGPADDPRRRLVNLLTVARLIARAALRREESRGGHFRDDFPACDDARWQVHAADVRADR